MAKLELEFVGFNDALNRMTINGKFAQIEKMQDGTKKCVAEVTEPTAEVVVYKSHYYTGKAWFWWALLYYVISLFGIFDARQDKKCMVIDCRFKINLDTDKKVVLKVKDFEDGGKFLEFEGETQVEELINKQYFDMEARKRHKKMRKAKAAMTVCSLVIIAFVLIFTL